MLNPLIEKAYAVLSGGELDRETAVAIAEEINGCDLLDLISLANKVRAKYAPAFQRCSILNAKSGRCAQNCRFCAQSAGHDTGIETYPLMDKQAVLEEARKVHASGVRSFGYVTSGRGYSENDAEFHRILETLELLHDELPDLKLCVSIGILSEEAAKMLAGHHTWRYNMNLQTSPERYGELIADTHSVQEKIATIRHLQKYGVSICCGGIIGLGESWRDRVDMAFAVREIDPEGVPLNVLLPIKGTPLANTPLTTPAEAAKCFALFRLINPARMIKFAAGRETTMKDFQGLLMLAGANAVITGGYLTTRGREVEDDARMLDHLADFGG